MKDFKNNNEISTEDASYRNIVFSIIGKTVFCSLLGKSVYWWVAYKNPNFIAEEPTALEGMTKGFFTICILPAITSDIINLICAAYTNYNIPLIVEKVNLSEHIDLKDICLSSDHYNSSDDNINDEYQLSNNYQCALSEYV